MREKLLWIFFEAFFFCIPGFSQTGNGVFRCKEETFQALKQISKDIGYKGEILLSRTTHQDLGWIDEVEKCIILRDTLWLTPYLERLKHDPGFKMDVEQSSIIMEYLNRHPEKKEEINKGLTEKRISVGATYTQPYEEMYNGESLIRQLYLGKKWLKDNFNGYESDIYYNSDVPGRTLQMPQILAKAGVKNMFISRQEKGIFDWYSPDGSMVTTFAVGHYIDFFLILLKDDEAAVAKMAEDVLFWANYFSKDTKKVIIPTLLNYEFIWDQKAVKNCDPFLSLWNGIKYIENEKGERMKVTLPKIRYENLSRCLSLFHENTDKINSISGERPAVWLYIHGPSHHYAISVSKKGDILLPDAEKFSVINSLLEGNFKNYNEERLNKAWRAKIYPDHGWGGKGGEITDRLFLSKFVEAENEASYLLETALQRIASKINYKGSGIPLVVFNGLNWSRTDPVDFKCSFNKGEAYSLILRDANDQVVDVQLNECQYYDDGTIKSCVASFMAHEIPSVGYVVYYVKPQADKRTDKILCFKPDFDNKFFSLKFGNGGIERLYDKTLKKEIIDPSKFRLGEVFTMQSIGNGAGEFSEVQQPSMEGFDKTGNYTTKWELVSDGPVYTTFRFRQPINYAVIEETIRIYHQKKQIDFEVNIKNWQGVLYREFRLAFPLNMINPKITYEVPMGTVEVGKDEINGAAGYIYTTECYKIHPRTLVDWVNASDHNFGATIGSDVIAFDYIDPTPNPMNTTLIQPILMASRKSCHYEGNDYIQLGDHQFKFSLYLDEAGWQNGFHEGKQSQNKIYSLTNPIKAEKKLLPETKSFFTINGNLIYLSAMKKCENDNSVIVRLVDMSGQNQTIDMHLFMSHSRIRKTNLIEEEQNYTKNETDYGLTIEKKSIETFKLKFNLYEKN